MPSLADMMQQAQASGRAVPGWLQNRYDLQQSDRALRSNLMGNAGAVSSWLGQQSPETQSALLKIGRAHV